MPDGPPVVHIIEPHLKIASTSSIRSSGEFSFLSLSLVSSHGEFSITLSHLISFLLQVADGGSLTVGAAAAGSA